jgi:hypothetical protein
LEPRDVKNCMMKMNAKLMSMPLAKFHPIPPLDLMEETQTPIKVKIIMENGLPTLLYFSVM